VSFKIKPPKRHKYNAKPTVYRGWRFDSKAEAQFAMMLDQRKSNGDIILWLRQTSFDLGEDTRYRADFVVVERDGETYAVDVKGMETGSFKKIKKLWKKYGELPLRIIKKGRLVETINGNCE